MKCICCLLAELTSLLLERKKARKKKTKTESYFSDKKELEIAKNEDNME